MSEGMKIPVVEPRPEKNPQLQKLVDEDDEYTDSAAVLATREDWYRTEHLGQDNGVNRKSDLMRKAVDFFRKMFRVSGDGEKARLARDRAADAFSDEALGRMVAERAKWKDDLTGLKNKNAYLQEVPQYIREKRKQYERSKNPDISQEHRKISSDVPGIPPQCAVLMIDFDHFKKVNDVHGHLAGDQALQQMARLIQESVRGTDSVYRFGGEEMVVFLPDTPSVQAGQVAEKIRKRIEEATINVTDKEGQPQSLKKTVSVGCVGTDQLDDWGSLRVDRADEFSDMMVKFADQAVYAAKEDGRNRVVLYEPVQVESVVDSME
jgi:diguanylate cyclase (GGDEF)-like protein